MSTFLSSLIESGPRPALTATMVFHEARLRTIAENIANMHTPGYRAKQLDPAVFQRALQRAMAQKGDDASKPLRINAGESIRTDESGRLRIVPTERPVENILFHDGTNQSLERQMAELAKTAMAHDLAAQLLRTALNDLRSAIRGTVR